MENGSIVSVFDADKKSDRSVVISSIFNENTGRQMLRFYISDLITGGYKNFDFLLVKFGYLPNIYGSCSSVTLPLQWLRAAQTDYAWQATYDLNGEPYSANFKVYRDNTFIVLELATYSSQAEVDIDFGILF